MADSPSNFKGKIVAKVQITAQEGQVDKLIALGKDIQDYILAGNEPGCLSFKIYRSGDDFMAIEEYANLDALKAHTENPKFQAFQAEVKKGTLVVGIPQPTFYEEL